MRAALYSIGSVLPMNSAVDTEPASRPTLFIEPPGLDFHSEHLGLSCCLCARVAARGHEERERSSTAIHRIVRISMWRQSYCLDVDGLDHRLTFGHLQRLGRQFGAYPLMAVAGRLERFLSDDLAALDELGEQVHGHSCHR